jgi:hypothetical protein
MDLEACWYEAAPFIYTVTGGIFLGRADSLMLTVPALLLVTAGGTIIFLRRKHSLQQIRAPQKTPLQSRFTPAVQSSRARRPAR